jgi:hypothetical protein
MTSVGTLGTLPAITADWLTSAGIANNAITAAKIATDAIGSDQLATTAVDEIVNQVWDEIVSTHAIPGSTGEAMSAAATGGDPWGTAIPGTYDPGTAGYILGNNVNATISSRLAPTVEGYELAVTATGAAGIDWANIENKTATNNLSNTTVGVVSSLAGIAQNVITAASINANAITAAKIDTGAITSAKFAAGAINTAALASGAITSDIIAAGAIGSSQLAATAVDEIVDQVWNEALSGHVIAGSTAVALAAAEAAVNPWTTAIPGAFDPGTAGFILGTNLDAKVSSRLEPSTAGRKLDVSAGGEAGIDWANVGGQGTTVALTGTTVAVATGITTPTDSSGVSTLLTRLSAGRAGYLDNLSAGSVALASGVTVATNNDKAGYSLAQTFPINFALLGINGSGHVSRVTLCDTISAYTGNTIQTGDAAAILGSNGTSLTGIPWNSNWNAEVQRECNDAIVANNLDHLMLNAVASNFSTTVHADSVIGQLAGEAGELMFDRATDSLQAIRDRGDIAWVSAGATAPTVQEITSHIDSNSTKLATILEDTNELQAEWADGGRLDLILDAKAMQSLLTTVASYIDTEVAAIKAKTDLIPTVPAAVGSEMDLSSAAIAGILEEALATHATVGGSLAAVLKFIKDVLEGDWFIEETGVPFEEVIKIKGTATELVRKKLRDSSGGSIINETTFVAEAASA